MNVPALKLNIAELVEEYNHKLSCIKDVLAEFKQAGDKLSESVSLRGTYGRQHIDTGHVNEITMKRNLLCSAWLHTYERLKIEVLSSPNDKKKFEQSLDQLPEFTLENIRATFGDYVIDPRGSILRGMAEVFSSLGPAYKSHEKVKIGAKGLPKRVIISNVNEYCYGYGFDKIKSILKALAAYQGKPLPEHGELSKLMKEGSLLKNEYNEEKQVVWNRGVWLKKFKNGNAHLFFDGIALQDINMALREYYGDVLADTPDRSTKSRSTAVSKDLQYYPTPKAVVDRLLDDVYFKNDKVLEPSCGCGRIMDAVRDMGGDVYGMEVDLGRAMEAKAKGHKVQVVNFLETIPTGDYDYVIMNPPFYGKHYALHVEHALKFVKEGGRLKAILPATARYDHGLLDGWWSDLPIGSFKESGTNINTTILTIRKNKL